MRRRRSCTAACPLILSVAAEPYLTYDCHIEPRAYDHGRCRKTVILQERIAKASVFPEIPAVEVAYAALQRALKEDGRRFRIAKDLTEERVFFMTLCFMTCPRRYTPSAYKVDGNKALRNFAEFATA
ncbi:hypothetical protein HPB51_017958 [Rhipicephalus microplus]|uniref:Tick transposon n=1 Tax=Rhipicephalus microplus TaxID=6941 RepID=A0A9J6ENV1_RHIMP|nr:hypothetical protein HPB51_017958 [Rhipicephalus microplus]